MKVDRLHVNAARKADRRREQEAWRLRLGRGRYADLVKEISSLIRNEHEAKRINTLMGLEGPLRQKIRADLCLMRWTWDDAERMAKGLLDDAHNALNVIRPSWNEGQPEWTVETGPTIERTRCVRCFNPLPEGAFKYCSRNCRAAHISALSRVKEASEEAVLRLVINNRLT